MHAARVYPLDQLPSDGEEHGRRTDERPVVLDRLGDDRCELIVWRLVDDLEAEASGRDAAGPLGEREDEATCGEFNHLVHAVQLGRTEPARRIDREHLGARHLVAEVGLARRDEVGGERDLTRRDVSKRQSNSSLADQAGPLLGPAEINRIPEKLRACTRQFTTLNQLKSL